MTGDSRLGLGLDVIAVLPDDARVLSRFGQADFGPLSLPRNATGKADGFMHGSILGQERPLGCPIEVDPPFFTGKQDDEIRSHHGTGL